VTVKTHVPITRKKAFQIVTWVIAGIIGLAIAGFLFIEFMPGYGLYIVRSGSMTPALEVGDLIVTRPAGELQTGQIVTFTVNGETITHRIIAREGDRLTTKGDANSATDSNQPRITDVQGAYFFKIPMIGYITKITSTRQGWFLAVIVPSILLVLALVYEIIKEAFKPDKPKVIAKTAPDQAGIDFTRPLAITTVSDPAPAASGSSPLPVPAMQDAAGTPATHSVFSSPEVTEGVRNEIKQILS
jgi:signal peptidase I